ncbi:mCG1048411 [Mus musculus]|nr:mCG1048411 [Mus musculus]
MVLGREASILGQLHIKLEWRLLKGSDFLAHAHWRKACYRVLKRPEFSVHTSSNVEWQSLALVWFPPPFRASVSFQH